MTRFAGCSSGAGRGTRNVKHGKKKRAARLRAIRTIAPARRLSSYVSALFQRRLIKTMSTSATASHLASRKRSAGRGLIGHARFFNNDGVLWLVLIGRHLLGPLIVGDSRLSLPPLYACPAPRAPSKSWNCWNSQTISTGHAAPACIRSGISPVQLRACRVHFPYVLDGVWASSKMEVMSTFPLRTRQRKGQAPRA